VEIVLAELVAVGCEVENADVATCLLRRNAGKWMCVAYVGSLCHGTSLFTPLKKKMRAFFGREGVYGTVESGFEDIVESLARAMLESM
jgi:hypothetical protein